MLFFRYVDNIAYDLYVPDLDAKPGRIAAEDDSACLSNGNVPYDGPVSLQNCAPHNDQQQWVMTHDGYLQLNFYPKHELSCLHLETIELVGCEGAETWEAVDKQIRLKGDNNQCLERSKGNRVRVRDCKDGLPAQEWQRTVDGTNKMTGFTLQNADSGHCLDNMQRARGPPGLYGCHGGGTQRWLLDDGKYNFLRGEGGGDA